MTEAKPPPPGACLIPVNLDDPDECVILRAQRIICGWKIEIAQKVRKQMAEGRRTLYWICLPPNPEALEAYSAPDIAELPRIAREHDDMYLPIGHISLDKQDWPEVEGMEPELGLASPDGSILTITTLFVCTKIFFAFFSLARETIEAQ